MIFAMSDIHGCLAELNEKLELVDLSGSNKLIFIGDYIDYGPKSGQVLHKVYELQQQYGSDKVIALKGNHEAMLLEWVDEYKDFTPFIEESAFDSWLKTDAVHGYNAFKTLVSEKQFNEFLELERESSFAHLNVAAVKMVMQENNDLINWIRTMESFYETDTQIFVHAGVDEEAEEYWKWGASDEMFLWKFPATFGHFYKTVIAGHIGTNELAKNPVFHDIYHDKASHYYIDGSVYKQGKLLLLGFDENTGKYYQIEKHKMINCQR